MTTTPIVAQYILENVDLTCTQRKAIVNAINTSSTVDFYTNHVNEYPCTQFSDEQDNHIGYIISAAKNKVYRYKDVFFWRDEDDGFVTSIAKGNFYEYDVIDNSNILHQLYTNAEPYIDTNIEHYIDCGGQVMRSAPQARRN